jgi:dUTP pyrophosphatase
MLVNISIHTLSHATDLPLPSYATVGSAGADVIAAVAEAVTLNPGARTLIPTGICVSLPQGWEIQIRPRSGLAFNHGITVLNTPGTIDSDYRGEIKVLLINHGDQPFTVTRGMRIAQIILTPVHQIHWQPIADHQEFLAHDPTTRDSGGFGSTGLNLRKAL